METTVELRGSDFFNRDTIPLRVLRRNPQPEYPLHTHDFSEIFIVLGGEGTHFTESGSCRLKRGDVFVINGDHAHGFKNIDGLNLINILFSLERLGLPEFDINKSSGFHALFTVEPILGSNAEGAMHQLCLNEIQLAAAMEIVARMENERNDDEVSQFMAAGLFMQLIAFLSRSYSGAHGEDTEGLYRLARVISYMENNMDRSITVGELLEISKTSESTLLRMFRKITSESPVQYHLRKRVEKSCWYLMHTDSQVTEIAYDFGFDDSNYYSRQFRRIKGMSPVQYRKNSRGI
jgi:AraC-like DNA-binding protein